MKVFVYGTLKQNFIRNGILAEYGAKFLGKYTTEPIYTMYDLGSFPALTFGGETPIIGEVYEIEDEVLDVLDQIEGHPYFYKREEIETSFGTAWAYFMPPERDMNKIPIVQSGNWGATS